ncbi:hypothetical protein GCM10010412_098680 [Nonomuraea recticatena]|uniref:Uncharacterized protein n=1 Tax=Nonomuraea recticatena TaxID=46178 RepID=A0ABP6FV19_9ACTN
MIGPRHADGVLRHRVPQYQWEHSLDRRGDELRALTLRPGLPPPYGRCQFSDAGRMEPVRNDKTGQIWVLASPVAIIRM